MTPAAFRKLALSLPEAAASSHFGTPDFRVGGKIFASAGKRDGYVVLKLAPDQQAMLCAAEPEIFAPIDHAWGRKGWTSLVLGKVDVATAKSALWMAWGNTAPRKLLKDHPAGNHLE